MLAGCRLAPDLIALEQWRALVGQTLTISGTLTEDPSLTSGQIALRLGNLQIHPATDAPDPPPSQPVENSVDNPVENSGEGTSAPISLPGTLYVTLSGSDGLTADGLLRSDHLTLNGTLQAGFGTFAATLYRPTVTGWSRASPGDLAAQFKLWFASLVQTYIPSPASDLGLSYLLGYKAGLSDELSDTLQIVGMTHVVVASGSHLGILVGAARKLFGRLSKFASPSSPSSSAISAAELRLGAYSCWLHSSLSSLTLSAASISVGSSPSPPSPASSSSLRASRPSSTAANAPLGSPVPSSPASPLSCSAPRSSFTPSATSPYFPSSPISSFSPLSLPSCCSFSSPASLASSPFSPLFSANSPTSCFPFIFGLWTFSANFPAYF